MLTTKSKTEHGISSNWPMTRRLYVKEMCVDVLSRSARCTEVSDKSICISPYKRVGNRRKRIANAITTWRPFLSYTSSASFFFLSRFANAGAAIPRPPPPSPAPSPARDYNTESAKIVDARVYFARASKVHRKVGIYRIGEDFIGVEQWGTSRQLLISLVY